MLVSWRH